MKKTMTEQEIKQKEMLDYVKKLNKQVRKQLSKLSDTNDTIDVLLLYLKEKSTAFAMDFEMIERDMIKWSLKRNITQTQLLIDKIEEIEAEYDLPLHCVDDVD